MYPLFRFHLANKSRYRRANKLRVIWARILFILTGIRERISGAENLPVETPVIFCPNHTSYLDIPAVTLALKKYHIRFLAKAELGNIPLFGIFFRTIDIAVNRESTADSVRSLQQASEVLHEGDSLIIFPEATIHKDAPQLHRFKNGAFRLAIENQIPIVPITFADNWRLLDVDHGFSGTPGQARIFIHPPISTKNLTLNDVDSLKEKTFRIIHEQLIQSGILQK